MMANASSKLLLACLRSNNKGIFTEPLRSNDEGTFTEPLSSNDRWIFIQPLRSNDEGTFTKPLSNNDKGIQIQQRDLISLLLFFQNKDSKLKITNVPR
jgi:hypothetical protein